MLLKDIEQVLGEFVQTSPLNRVEELGGLVIFDQPVVGVASADDALFYRLKETTVIGSHHMSPREWLKDASAVIVYFLPFTAEVRTANRVMGVAAREWLYGRIEGEAFNNALREHLVNWLRGQEYRALAPALDERFKVVNRLSNWSERHAAYIAGVGTFSLSRSLITKRGSAGRLGSVITNVTIEPTPRNYTAVDEYCTKCGCCIMRCPPLAINEQGKDNVVCSDYLDRVLAKYRPRYGCGKCQTAVPCEDKIPVATVCV